MPDFEYQYLQDSVATHLSFRGIFSDNCIANAMYCQVCHWKIFGKKTLNIWSSKIRCDKNVAYFFVDNPH